MVGVGLLRTELGFGNLGFMGRLGLVKYDGRDDDVMV